jgi:hypothetical protein
MYLGSKGGNQVKFEYLAMIGAAIFISNAMGDALTGVTWLTIGDLSVALAIVCIYIDVFIKRLQTYKKNMLTLGGIFACIGVISYIVKFI